MDYWRQHTVINKASMAIIAGTFLLLMTCFVGLVAPYKTIDVSSFTVQEVRPRAANVGQIVEISMELMKYTALPCRYSVGILNGSYHIVESGISNLPEGHAKIIRNIKVSEEIPSGVYRVQYTISYDVNPIKTVTKTFLTSNAFEIRQ